MYRNRIIRDASERLKREGGVIRNDSIHLNPAISNTVIKKENDPVQVYKPRGNGGPLSTLDRSITFYDFMMDESDETRETKERYFEDWCFPRIKDIYGENELKQYVIPVRTFARGTERFTDPESETDITVLSPGETRQYGYIILGPGYSPIRSFGEYPGMVPQKLAYMVCVNMGNPRSGRTDEVYIEYALIMNQPMVNCIEMVSMDYNPATKSPEYYYKIKGDENLERKIFERWFNAGDHYFNTIIFPRVRSYSEIL